MCNLPGPITVGVSVAPVVVSASVEMDKVGFAIVLLDNVLLAFVWIICVEDNVVGGSCDDPSRKSYESYN